VIRRALAVGVLTLITACGNPGTGQSPKSIGVLPPADEVNPSTFPPPPSPQVLFGSQRLTSINNGDTVKLAVGQRIDISLGGFDPIDETGAAFTVTAHRGGYPSNAPATGSYLAIAPGTATLQTTSDTACLHGKPPCEIAVTMWQSHGRRLRHKQLGQNARASSRHLMMSVTGEPNIYLTAGAKRGTATSSSTQTGTSSSDLGKE
jgi:hypothetical protein